MSALNSSDATRRPWSNLAAPWTILKLSWIVLLRMKALWLLWTNDGSFGLCLLANTFKNSLPMELIKAIDM
jgi:hypothetical protein